MSAATTEEWKETALKFSDDYHAELNRRIAAEQKVAAVEALCAEHERTVSPAPYTTERALIERLRAALTEETP